MPLLNFQKCYADDVARGVKKTTIRRKRKVPINVNDTLHLYTGLRTRDARRLGMAICTGARSITIHMNGDVRVNGVILDPADETDLITRDGFNSKGDFMAYFGRDGFPFDGDLISWGALFERPDAA